MYVCAMAGRATNGQFKLVVVAIAAQKFLHVSLSASRICLPVAAIAVERRCFVGDYGSEAMLLLVARSFASALAGRTRVVACDLNATAPS
jgi:hypothetical protein